MLIDNDFNEKLFRIRLDITLHRFPCHILSLCQEDDLGHHSVGVEDNLKKVRLNR
jgi:hypothetical protein